MGMRKESEEMNCLSLASWKKKKWDSSCGEPLHGPGQCAVLCLATA
jgi:hypothetical protein